MSSPVHNRANAIVARAVQGNRDDEQRYIRTLRKMAGFGRDGSGTLKLGASL
jgi:hypothetical protein